MRLYLGLLMSLLLSLLIALPLPAAGQGPDTPGIIAIGPWELTLTYAHTVNKLESGFYPNQVTYTADLGYVFLELMIKAQLIDPSQTTTLKDSEFEMVVVDANGVESHLEGTGSGFNNYCMLNGCRSEFDLAGSTSANVLYVFTVSSDVTDPNYTLKIAPDISIPFTVPFVADFDAQFAAEEVTPITRADLKPITLENATSLAALSGRTVYGYYISDLTFSADGSRLASTGCDLYGKSGCLSSVVRTWDLDGGQLDATVYVGDTTSGGVYALELSADGSRLAGLDWETVHLWDMETGDPLPVTVSAESVGNLMIAPDGTRLVTCAGDGITFWDTGTGESGMNLPGPCKGGTFSPDGQWLATYGGTPGYGDGDGLIYLWDTVSGQAGPIIGQSDANVVQSRFVFSPDNTLLASGHPSTYDGDGIIHLWDTASGAERVAWQQADTSKGVLSLAFSPDGSLLASAEENGTVHLWNVSTQQEIAVLGEPGARGVTQMAFNAEGTLLALGRGNATVELWGVSGAPTASPPAATIAPGEWNGTAEFGTFVLTVNPDGTGVSHIALSFSGYACGGSTLSGDMAIGDLEWEGVPITDGMFTFSNPQVTFEGTFDANGTSASGIWSMTDCAGMWAASAAGDTTASDGGESAATASDGPRLYVCEPKSKEEAGAVAQPKFLAESCEYYAWGQHIFYPHLKYSRDIPYVLMGDIKGTSYLFNTWFASGGTTTLLVEIVLRQGDTETVLAATTITSKSTQFSEFTEILTGPDPDTVAGDVLILRITATAGVDGAIAITDDPDETTYLQIPPIEESAIAFVPTESPTATVVPTEAPTATVVPTEAPTATVVPTEPPTATVVPTEPPTATVVPTEPPTATAMPTEAPIVDLEYGGSLEDTIYDSSEERAYTFEGQANEAVTIVATADDDRRFDLALDLLDSNGTVLATNDDYNRFNPAIVERTLPVTGQYTIIVRSVEGTGTFTLEIERVVVLRPGEILFSETFDNNDVRWETASFDKVISELRDGVYVIEYTTIDPWNTWLVAPGFGNPAAAPYFTVPYEVQFEVSNMFSRTGKYYICMMFNVLNNYAGWHELGFYDEGTWALFATDSEETLDYGFFEPIDFLDGNTHTMTARIFEDRVELLVDGELIGESSIKLNWSGGAVGFGIASHPDDSGKIFIEAHFDNLVVREMVGD